MRMRRRILKLMGQDVCLCCLGRFLGWLIGMLLCPLALDYFFIFLFIFFHYGAGGGTGGWDTECKENGMGREMLTHGVMQ